MFRFHRLLLVIPLLAPLESVVAAQVVDKAEILGSWTVRYAEQNGRPAPHLAGKLRMDFRPHHVDLVQNTMPATQVAYYIDLRRNPGTFTWSTYGYHSEIRQLGIYHLDDDTLTICMAPVGAPAPSTFQTSDRYGQTLFVMHRTPAKPSVAWDQPKKRLRLGVYSLAIKGESQVRAMINLYTDDSGTLSGHVYYLQTNQRVPLKGSIDRTTLQVKIETGKNKSTVLTTFVSGLSAPRTDVSVQHEGRPPETWTMINLFDDKEPPVSESGEVLTPR